MASTTHSYGQKCRLAPLQRAPCKNGMPHVIPQFFYSSLIPIDDPLSAARRTGSSDGNASKLQFRPFGRGDNHTLEKAWSQLASEHLCKEHSLAQSTQSADSSANPCTADREKQAREFVEKLALQHLEKHGGELQVQSLENGHLPQTATTSAVCCSSLRRDVVQMLQEQFCALSVKSRPELAPETLSQSILDAMNSRNSLRSNQSFALHRADPSKSKTNQKEDVATRSNTCHIVSGELAHDQRVNRSSSSSEDPTIQSDRHGDLPIVPGSTCLLSTGVATSGPSVRLEDHTRCPTSSQKEDAIVSRSTTENKDDGPGLSCNTCDSDARIASEFDNVARSQSATDVVVGVSRLHKVSLPILLMKPIYWSPVKDVAVVMRATWFYRDTMMPIAPPVANQLEAGYQELRPWTETWRDEIRCATEIGPAGEEKVSHYLWPQDSKHSCTGPGYEPEPKISSHPFCAARCFHGDAAAQGVLAVQDSALLPISERAHRAFTNYHVIYKNEREAFLLKPALKPSGYYGRKPVAKIMKGFTVGLPVVRGFDRCVWDRLHGPKHGLQEAASDEPLPIEPTPPTTTTTTAAAAAAATFPNTQLRNCDACEEETHAGRVTDLIFVAHGIGQKLAEKVESYHFTHAINDFRRAVNLEMGTSAVQQVLRQGQNDVMILPLNWRLGLSFDQATSVGGEGLKERRQTAFSLKDIEPNTIPAIRSIISDVMFDIPFYMSHHKSRMINALVSEANRVYRLWCQNNPGFSTRGRVHLIAHSLGSVMAVDILSRQPTQVPAVDLSLAQPGSRFFEFNTTNLFLLGSPVGFFLLLEQAGLTPRRDRWKPGADVRDMADKNIVGDEGTFGCLAVDNIYNVLAREDPIAYLLNGVVDPTYSAALKTAFVPSASVSMLKSVADAVRQIVPGLSPSSDVLKIGSERPPTARLPSQLELEVHDFTREEIAEKRAFLLNDNGQIDWFLKSGGGPLEIQYLNMLSAHTSYWVNQDFIRMLCVEVGRQPGRAYTLPAMRAVKAARRFSSAE